MLLGVEVLVERLHTHLVFAHPFRCIHCSRSTDDEDVTVFLGSIPAEAAVGENDDGIVVQPLLMDEIDNALRIGATTTRDVGFMHGFQLSRRLFATTIPPSEVDIGFKLDEVIHILCGKLV